MSSGMVKENKATTFEILILSVLKLFKVLTKFFLSFSLMQLKILMQYFLLY